jgi:LacI family transcriptional regulator
MSSSKLSLDTRVTMADVARAAGVSVMSVSRALRGVGKVSPATVELIRQTARDLGYQPNAMVQTLMANVRRGHVQQRSNLAWIKTHRGEPPIAVRRIEASARRRAQELGYELENIYLPPAELDAAAIQRMLSQPGTIRNFPWDRFPIATVGRSLLRPSLHYTMSHYHHAMARLLDELTARGYRKISYLKSKRTTDRSEQTSTMVFERHCLKLGFAPSETIREIGDWRTFDFRSWWEDSRPDAIVGDYSDDYFHFSTRVCR